MRVTTSGVPATPREAFDLLTTGNLRFAAGAPQHPAVVGLTYRPAEGSVRTVASRGLDLPPAGATAAAITSTPTDW